jgi:hypothetical protein
MDEDEEDGFSTTPAPRQDPILSFVREHITLIASVVAALIFALRVSAVTRDPNTAFILLAHTSLGDALRALLFSQFPLIFYITAWLLLARAAGRYRWNSLEFAVLVFWSLVANLFGLLFEGEGLLNFRAWFHYFLIALVAIVLGMGLSKERVLGSFTRYSVIITLVLVAGAQQFAMDTIVSKDFWLPKERLVFASERKPVVGYVLKTGDNHFVILNDDPRIIIEKQGKLSERDYCYPEGERYEKAFKELERDIETC